MSTFYRNYIREQARTLNPRIKEEEIPYPYRIKEEIVRQKRMAMLIRQHNMFFGGKHVGSKSINRILTTVHRGNSRINSYYSGYSE